MPGSACRTRSPSSACRRIRRIARLNALSLSIPLFVVVHVRAVGVLRAVRDRREVLATRELPRPRRGVREVPAHLLPGRARSCSRRARMRTPSGSASGRPPASRPLTVLSGSVAGRTRRSGDRGADARRRCPGRSPATSTRCGRGRSAPSRRRRSSCRSRTAGAPRGRGLQPVDAVGARREALLDRPAPRRRVGTREAGVHGREPRRARPAADAADRTVTPISGHDGHHESRRQHGREHSASRLSASIPRPAVGAALPVAGHSITLRGGELLTS